MNHRLQKLVYFMGIMGAEMAFIWIGYHLFFPTSPYQHNLFSDSLSPEWVAQTLPLPADTPELREEIHPDTVLPVPIFPLGTAKKQILATLGEPVWRKKGYWANSIAWSYEDVVSDNIDLGYLFDTRTKKLRQTEIVVPASTNLATLQTALNGFLENQISAIAERGLEAVYLRQTKSQTFNVGDLEGVIQRKEQDRIYIGVWEADFH